LGIIRFIRWKVDASLYLDQNYRSLQWSLSGKCETERKYVNVCAGVESQIELRERERARERESSVVSACRRKGKVGECVSRRLNNDR